jgi:hypothetical protein
VQPTAPAQGGGVEGILAFLVQQARDREEKERQERRDREEREDRERLERRDREERERDERRREEEARRREEDARREREESRNAQRMALFGSLATAFAPVVIELVKSKATTPAPSAMPDLRPVLDTMTSMIEQNQRVSATLLDATIDRAKTIAGLGQPEKPGILDRLASVAEAVAPAIAARFAGEAPPAPTAMPVASQTVPTHIPAPALPIPVPAPSADMTTTTAPATDEEPTMNEILTACEVPTDATGLRRALWILRAFHAGLPDQTWIDDLMAEVKAQIPEDLAAAITAGDSAKVLAQAQPVVIADPGLMRWIMGGGGAWLQAQMGNLRALFNPSPCS